MLRSWRVVSVVGCGLLCMALRGQTSAEPQFDVAAIRPNTSGAGNGGGTTPNGRLQLQNVSLTALIQIAYDVRDDQIVSKSGWTHSDRFDVNARATEGARESEIPRMLQSLLATRFKLLVHADEQKQDVFVLTIARGGSRLSPSKQADSPGCKRSMVDGRAHADCNAMTMERFCTELRFLAPGYIDRRIVDQTGIVGEYDFVLEWVGNARVAEGGLTMFDALIKQLGLKLEQQKIPDRIIVVDRAEHLRDEN